MWYQRRIRTSQVSDQLEDDYELDPDFTSRLDEFSSDDSRQHHYSPRDEALYLGRGAYNLVQRHGLNDTTASPWSGQRPKGQFIPPQSLQNALGQIAKALQAGNLSEEEHAALASVHDTLTKAAASHPTGLTLLVPAGSSPDQILSDLIRSMVHERAHQYQSMLGGGSTKNHLGEGQAGAIRGYYPHTGDFAAGLNRRSYQTTGDDDLVVDETAAHILSGEGHELLEGRIHDPAKRERALFIWMHNYWLNMIQNRGVEAAQQMLAHVKRPDPLAVQALAEAIHLHQTQKYPDLLRR